MINLLCVLERLLVRGAVHTSVKLENLHPLNIIVTIGAVISDPPVA